MPHGKSGVSVDSLHSAQHETSVIHLLPIADKEVIWARRVPVILAAAAVVRRVVGGYSPSQPTAGRGTSPGPKYRGTTAATSLGMSPARRATRGQSSDRPKSLPVRDLGTVRFVRCNECSGPLDAHYLSPFGGNTITKRIPKATTPGNRGLSNTI
jgi:hypothetical protein